MSETEALQKILAGIAELKSEISGLRQQMQDSFGQVEMNIREVRTIQDVHGKELNRLVAGVESINRKLARLGEVLR